MTQEKEYNWLFETGYLETIIDIEVYDKTPGEDSELIKYYNKEDIIEPDKDRLVCCLKNEAHGYYWMDKLPNTIFDNFQSAISEREFVDNLHQIHLNIYNYYNNSKYKYTKYHEIGKFVEPTDEKIETIEGELGYYKISEKRDNVYELKRLGGITAPAIGINVVFSIVTLFMGLGVLMPQIVTILITLLGGMIGAYYLGSKNTQKLKEVDEFSVKYDIIKSFQKLLQLDMWDASDYRVARRVNENGIEEILPKVNKVYKLSDGLPVRLYQLLTVKDNKIVLSHSVEELDESENYKELLVEPISEESFVELYNKLIKERDLEENYKLLNLTQKQLEEQTENTKKAREFVSEYNKLYEKNKEQLGIGVNKEKWDDRLETIKQQKQLMLEENDELTKLIENK